MSLLLRGRLDEHHLDGKIETHKAPKIIFTRRDTFHKVYSRGTSYVLSLRGPWSKTWFEVASGRKTTLAHGRKAVN